VNTGPPTQSDEPGPAIRSFVERTGLVDEPHRVRFTPLGGGVSSDIWRVDEDGRSFCVKQALARLKVAADWRVPVERNAYEARWLRAVAQAVPGAAPRVIGEDADAGLFAMEYLAPERFRLWKTDLLAGHVDLAAAAAVGATLGQIHAAFARQPDAPSLFATDANFHAIRLEPYLLATAEAHPDRRAQLEKLAARTAATKTTVVHGDVSPKNILIGPEGPVFLDAECAWFGDAAFDLAFCLNHLLLKCLAAPKAAQRFLRAFDVLARSYLAAVNWEDAGALEVRAATLLPGLFLARVDGKSPVEYITTEADKDKVRRVARHLLAHPPARLATVAEAWAGEIETR
jgi:aminoglycoside phosphotransferase (APT) family kinase protein